MASGEKFTYQDASLDVGKRTDDLLRRMSLEEKAGLLFHNMVLPLPDIRKGPTEGFKLPSPEEYVVRLHINHLNIVGPINDAKVAATWYNDVQQMALKETRWGIPVTFSTDPRNHSTENPGTAAMAGAFSQWPETLGLAALRDPGLVQKFGDIARQEYNAVGLRCALHPQIDLGTEYRWARISATFGEDADLSGDMGVAYMKGFQGETFGKHSVSAMIKHFPGGGAQANDGEDSHFTYGKDQAYPAGRFDYHLEPFKKAIAAGARQIMPYYSRPVGTKYEEVGFGLNISVIDGLLRKELEYTGIVCTDWGLVTDAEILGQPMPARAWGAESLSELDRAVKIINASCDQFGGEHRPDLVIKAVKDGLISEERIDQSCRKLLTEKFELGLFDEKRFVDIDEATKIVGQKDFMEAGLDAQRRSCTLLKNDNDLLPLRDSTLSKKIYIEGIEPKLARQRGLNLVDEVSEADIAILRLRAPFEPRTGGFEAFFHAGSLVFPKSELARHQKIFDAVPIVIVDVYLDRPAVLTHLSETATALVVNFGISQPVMLDVLLGKVAESGQSISPQGKLPFDLPRSMEAVQKHPCDEPFGTENPIYKFGHGLRYE